ncbi:MAG: electron transfer flavoprotein subunit alpha/FixB family protein [Desulfobacterota bacterium]|nr:electron transfer flavoprotein subunit alpha/FixB family protein [Thermodesulfobacteriota bacterium]
MNSYNGIMVYVEFGENGLLPITRQLLGCGRKIADELGEPLSAVIVGSKGIEEGSDAAQLGADTVYIVEHELLRQYRTETYVAALEQLVRQQRPTALLMGQTYVGRDLAPSLAFRLETIAVLDCIALEIDHASRVLLLTKPVCGGNAVATFTSMYYPQIITIRDKAMLPMEPSFGKNAHVVHFAVSLEPRSFKTRLIKKVKEEGEGLRLEEAAVIISGGRGIGGAEGFRQLHETAAILHAAVGGSRPACDNRGVAPNRQIGITGKIVSPDLYIAVGISGSIQQMSGCGQAKRIVAINKDPDAPIFKYADFGVVGDWKKVFPSFSAKLKELVS